jgi:hypothetical protein
VRQARFLSQKHTEDELAVREGMIPVDIDTDRGRISWVDLERYHCYRGFFQDSLHSWAALRGSDPDSFTSSIDVLDSIRIPPNSLSPTAFIFHTGRCGSTLLAQVLARSRENMVFAEAAPHNQIWRLRRDVGSTGTESEVTAYRNLFLAMGRRRLPSYGSHIVKFTSFNILKFHRIRAAFPGVPALFLFREPAAMLDSYRRSSPSWMGRELGIGRILETPETAVEAFFREALSIRDPDFQCLDYALLTPASLPPILSFLRLTPSPQELRLMAEEFSWDARSGSIPRPFVPRCRASAFSAVVVPDTLQELYAQLTTWRPLVEQDRSDSLRSGGS